MVKCDQWDTLKITFKNLFTYYAKKAERNESYPTLWGIAIRRMYTAESIADDLYKFVLVRYQRTSERRTYGVGLSV